MTRLFTNRPHYRSLFALKVIVDAENTTILNQVVALVSIKNTNDDSYSPVKRVRLTCSRSQYLKQETFPKIKPDKSSGADNVFTFINHPATLFYDLDYIFKQKAANQISSKVYDFKLELRNCKSFLQKPFQ